MMITENFAKEAMMGLYASLKCEDDEIQMWDSASERL